MVAAAERVDAVPCAHPLEAAVRELRLIAEHAPRYNRRSKHPEKSVWVALTEEAFPRLTVVRRRRPGSAAQLGPFPSPRAAEAAVDALHEAFPLRRCRERLSPRRTTPACALAGMGRCVAPCERPDRAAYSAVAAAVGSALHGRPDEVDRVLGERMSGYAAQGRYEEAARARDRLTGYLRALARQQRLEALAAVPELVAAAPRGDGGWDLAVVRHGRLAAASTVASGAAVRPHLPGLRATAEAVPPGEGPVPAATREESELLLRWLETPGTRLVDVEGTWALPAAGAGRRAAELAGRDDAVDPFADRRRLRPAARRHG